MKYLFFLLISFVLISCESNTSNETVDSRTNITGIWDVSFYYDSQYKNKELDSIVEIKVSDGVLYWDNINFDNLQFFNEGVNAMGDSKDKVWNYHLAITLKTKDSFEGSWGEMKFNSSGGLYSDTKYIKGERK